MEGSVELLFEENKFLKKCCFGTFEDFEETELEAEVISGN